MQTKPHHRHRGSIGDGLRRLLGGESTPSWTAFLSNFCKISMSSINNIGDNGSPCLSPLALCIGLPGQPFSRTLVVAVDTSAEIQSLHFGPKPSVCNTCRRKGQDTVSNALEMSSLSRMLGFFFLCRHFAACSTNLKLPCMDLCLMKALWFRSTRFCISGANQLANNFATNLAKL